MSKLTYDRSAFIREVEEISKEMDRQDRYITYLENELAKIERVKERIESGELVLLDSCCNHYWTDEYFDKVEGLNVETAKDLYDLERTTNGDILHACTELTSIMCRQKAANRKLRAVEILKQDRKKSSQRNKRHRKHRQAHAAYVFRGYPGCDKI